MASVHRVNSIFKTAFTSETQKELLEDDHFAWNSVCSILIAIVSMGLLLGGLGVTFSLLYG